MDRNPEILENLVKMSRDLGMPDIESARSTPFHRVGSTCPGD